MKKNHRGGIALLVACAFTGVWSVEPDAEERKEGEEPAFEEYIEVRDSSLPSSNTIATKMDVPLQVTPASVAAVGVPLLYERDARTLSAALETVSGINVQNGSGTFDFFSIRGFDSLSSALVMTDGVSEPETTYYETYNAEGVEVFKGPAGYLYGKNPIGGAVNFVRKQPMAGDLLAAAGSFGSFGRRSATLDWNEATESGKLAFRVNGLWKEAENYRDDMDSEHEAVNPSFTWRSEGGSRVTVNYENVEADYAPDSGIPLFNGAIPDVSRRRSYQSDGDFSEQTLDRVQVDFERPLSDRVTVRSKVYYRSLEWQSNGSLLYGAAELVPGFLPPQAIRDLALLDDEQEFLGAQFEVMFSGTTGPVEHRVLTGIEFLEESDEFTFDLRQLDDVGLFDTNPAAVNCGSDTTYDLFNPSNPANGCKSPELDSFGDVTNRTLAPYAIDQMQIAPEWQILAGARYDRIETDGDVLPLTPTAFVPLSPVTSYSPTEGKVSPMVGVLWAPTSELSVYVNGARSYSPPSTRIVDDRDPESREPERGTQLEIGAKRLIADGKVRTSIAAYRIDRDDIAIADANLFTQQTGDQRSRGVELELAAEPLPGVRTLLSYAYNDSELRSFRPFDAATQQYVDYSGNTPAMAPRNVATLWISKSFAGGFGVAAGARFIDDQFVHESNTFELDSAFLLDGGVYYDRKHWRFKVNLKNITDEEYEMRGAPGTTSSVIPADPFAAYGGIEFRM